MIHEAGVFTHSHTLPAVHGFDVLTPDTATSTDRTASTERKEDQKKRRGGKKRTPAYDRIMTKAQIGVPPAKYPELGPCLHSSARSTDLEGRPVMSCFDPETDAPITRRSAQVVLEHELGRPLRPGEQALHKCGDRTCINGKHLYAGNHKQNMKDKIKDGTAKNGPRLKASEMAEVVRLFREGHSVKSIVIMTGRCLATIKSIKRTLTKAYIGLSDEGTGQGDLFRTDHRCTDMTA